MRTDPSSNRLNVSLVKVITLSCLMLAMIGLSACGNKGNLYLPEKDQQQEEQNNQ